MYLASLVEFPTTPGALVILTDAVDLREKSECCLHASILDMLPPRALILLTDLVSLGEVWDCFLYACFVAIISIDNFRHISEPAGHIRVLGTF